VNANRKAVDMHREPRAHRAVFLALMAQFDVHCNTGSHKDTIPFVVIVQSAQFDNYRRRVVVPLVKSSAIGKSAIRPLTLPSKSAAPAWSCIRLSSFRYRSIN
jgi:CcdB protein